MTRVCHCVGYMTNPGGVCCRDLPQASFWTTSTNAPGPPCAVCGRRGPHFCPGPRANRPPLHPAVSEIVDQINEKGPKT